MIILARDWKIRKPEFGTSIFMHILHLCFGCFIRHLWKGKAKHKVWPILQEDIPDSTLRYTLRYVSSIGNSSPLEVKITFVMMNDSNNSDVKKPMVWNIEVFPNTIGGLCFLFYCLQCFQPLNTSFSFFFPWIRLRYQLLGVLTTMDNADRITCL